MNFTLMTTISVHYKPQDHQTFRCSDDFGNWNTPDGGALRFIIKGVPVNIPPPVFAIGHNKVGADTRWYSDLTNGSTIPVNSENGGSGGHRVYVGTLSDLPDGLPNDATYTVEVWTCQKWEAPPAPDAPTKFNLMHAYAPHVILAESERYFPSSVDWAMQPDRLIRFKNVDGKFWLKTAQNLTSPSQPDVPVFSGESDLNQVPVYAFWVQKENFFDITYFMYYPYNRGKEVAGTVWGNHVSDWEHVTVRLNLSLTPICIYMSQHSGGQTQYWPDVSKAYETHATVFSAWGSHGLYPDAGDHNYSVGLNDVTSNGTDWYTWYRVETYDWQLKQGLSPSVWPSWMSDRYGDDDSGAIYRWGNPHSGSPVPFTSNEYQLGDGPTGPVDKADVWDVKKLA